MEQNFEQAVGKTFVRKTDGLVFRVGKLLPRFDFGKRGKKPAFQVIRVSSETESFQRCEEFLKGHEALEADAPAETNEPQTDVPAE